MCCNINDFREYSDTEHIVIENVAEDFVAAEDTVLTENTLQGPANKPKKKTNHIFHVAFKRGWIYKPK